MEGGTEDKKKGLGERPSEQPAAPTRIELGEHSVGGFAVEKKRPWLGRGVFEDGAARLEVLVRRLEPRESALLLPLLRRRQHFRVLEVVAVHREFLQDVLHWNMR